MHELRMRISPLCAFLALDAPRALQAGGQLRKSTSPQLPPQHCAACGGAFDDVSVPCIS